MSKLAHSNDETMREIETRRLKEEGMPSYWMIERGSPCEWWVGNHRISNENGGEWTTDSSKAQHFNEWGAKQHAKELEQWGIIGPLIATEHIDLNGPPAPFTKRSRHDG